MELSNDERNKDITPLGSVAPSGVSNVLNAMSIVESSSGARFDDLTSSHRSPDVTKPSLGRGDLMMRSKSGLANIIEEDRDG